MTDRERAIIMAYTGHEMLKGRKIVAFQRYVEELMGRPVFGHELTVCKDQIKMLSKSDFMKLCVKY